MNPNEPAAFGRLERRAVDTAAVHADIATPSHTGMPMGSIIDPSTVWGIDDFEHLEETYRDPAVGYSYASRAAPNTDQLGAIVAELEGAQAGLATATGMSALSSLVFATTESGDEILAAEDSYGGTRDLLTSTLSKFGVHTRFVDPRNLAAVAAAATSRTKWLLVESMSNPLTRLVDLPGLRKIADRAGFRILCDNTFATPYLFRPLDHGAHCVWHSVSKFLGGHHDLMAGAIVGPDELVKRFRKETTRLGLVASAFSSWLAVRGIRSLGARMDRISMNAIATSSALAEHPELSSVQYPAMPSHPDFDAARRLFPHGAGGILTVCLNGGFARTERFVKSLRMVRLATSLGGTQTTISHPWSASHRSLPEAERRRLGIVPEMIRFSIGCESARDIIDDVESALDLSAD